MSNAKINYKDLIQELSEELEEGTLTQNDTIQILRAEEAIMQTYQPIIDWYYDRYMMKEELETPLEEIYLPEEFTKDEWKQLVKEQQEYKAQYASDQAKLVDIKVKDALKEMKQMQKLLGS